MQDPPRTVDWQDFLAKVPPGTPVEVPGLQTGAVSTTLQLPDVELYCDKKCNGMREFRCSHGAPSFYDQNFDQTFVVYRCKNCERCLWTFAVSISLLF